MLRFPMRDAMAPAVVRPPMDDRLNLFTRIDRILAPRRAGLRIVKIIANFVTVEHLRGDQLRMYSALLVAQNELERSVDAEGIRERRVDAAFLDDDAFVGTAAEEKRSG